MNDRRNAATANGRRYHPWIRLSIWSLKRHDPLLGLLRTCVWSFSAVVLLAAVAGRLDLETALRIIAFGGLAVVAVLTGLVMIRRNVLLSIDDPDLKGEAHHALLALIRSKTSRRSATQTESDRTNRSAAGGAHCPQSGRCGS